MSQESTDVLLIGVSDLRLMGINESIVSANNDVADMFEDINTLHQKNEELKFMFDNLYKAASSITEMRHLDDLVKLDLLTKINSLLHKISLLLKASEPTPVDYGNLKCFVIYLQFAALLMFGFVLFICLLYLYVSLHTF
jgi:hypothetical protein